MWETFLPEVNTRSAQATAPNPVSGLHSLVKDHETLLLITIGGRSFGLYPGDMGIPEVSSRSGVAG